ncbi:MAG TPA: DUF962 domain-containing protein [Planctomycetes bacterium]|nr:DUF962 domain-containing protein [Planctomycetota bacterium]HIK59535.1 DUF962 domain-containing protein [Planctomycetota bacterium]
MREEPTINSFEQFWPFYVGEHRVPLNRLLHYIGTSGGIAILVLTVFEFSSWWSMLAAPLVGYGFAFAGHFMIEGNKPASFRYPLWSFLADFKMLCYGLTGRMGREVARLYGSRHPAPDAPRIVS